MLWWTLREARSSNPAVRRAALRDLARHPDPRAADALVAALDDEDPTNGRAAAIALGNRRDPRGLPRLAALAASHFPLPERYTVVRLLRSMSGELAELVTGADRRTREAAAAALAQLDGAEAAIEPLLQALGHADPQVRAAALTALAGIGDARCLEPALALARDADEDVREGAVAALTGLAARGVAVDPAHLIERFSDSQARIRLAAAALLRTLGWQPRSAPERAGLALADSNWEGVVAAGSPGVPLLLAALGCQASHDVLRALGRIGDPAALEALVYVVGDGSEEERTRKAAALAVQEIGLQHLEPAARERVESVLARETSGERFDREISELVGTAIDAGRGWCGLPDGTTPERCASSDFLAVTPGTYVVESLVWFRGQPWFYLRQGSRRYLVDAVDVHSSRAR